MTDEEFRLFKDRLYRAVNALELSLKGCPDLETVHVDLKDGHKLFAHEILLWFKKARSGVWKYGPPKYQKFYIKRLVRKLPEG